MSLCSKLTVQSAFSSFWQINFYDAFVDPRKAALRVEEMKLYESKLKQFGGDTVKAENEVNAWRAEQNLKLGRTPLSMLVDHIEHVAKVIGIGTAHTSAAAVRCFLSHLPPFRLRGYRLRLRWYRIDERAGRT